MEKRAAAENLILSTDSRSAPPEAAETGVIVKLVNGSLNESTAEDRAIKLFALLELVPLVKRYVTFTIAPSGNDLPTTLLPK